MESAGGLLDNSLSECLQWSCSFFGCFFNGFCWVVEHLLIIFTLKPIRWLWGMVLSLLWAEKFGAQQLSVGVVSPELRCCNVGLVQQSENSFLWHCILFVPSKCVYSLRVSLLFWVIFNLVPSRSQWIIWGCVGKQGLKNSYIEPCNKLRTWDAHQKFWGFIFPEFHQPCKQSQCDLWLCVVFLWNSQDFDIKFSWL